MPFTERMTTMLTTIINSYDTTVMENFLDNRKLELHEYYSITILASDNLNLNTDKSLYVLNLFNPIIENNIFNEKLLFDFSKSSSFVLRETVFRVLKKHKTFLSDDTVLNIWGNDRLGREKWLQQNIVLPHWYHNSIIDPPNRLILLSQCSNVPLFAIQQWEKERIEYLNNISKKTKHKKILDRVKVRN